MPKGLEELGGLAESGGGGATRVRPLCVPEEKKRLLGVNSLRSAMAATMPAARTASTMEATLAKPATMEAVTIEGVATGKFAAREPAAE
jgi:hypothetical protein